MQLEIKADITFVDRSTDKEYTNYYFGRSFKEKDDILKSIKRRMIASNFKEMNQRYSEIVDEAKETGIGTIIGDMDILYPNVYFEKIFDSDPDIINLNQKHNDIYAIKVSDQVSLKTKLLGFIYIDYHIKVVESLEGLESHDKSENNLLEQYGRLESKLRSTTGEEE